MTNLAHEETAPRPTATRPAVFGTGLLALDVILGADPAAPPTFAAGGTCGNVLTVLSFLGWDAFPVARLNGDAASRLVREDLQQWNVRLEFVGQIPSAATPIIVQRNRHDAQHRFSMTCPECGAWFPPFRAVTQDGVREIVRNILDQSVMGPPQVFFFDRVSRGALLLAQACAARGAIVVFEPSSIGDPKLFEEALSSAHILKDSRDRLPDLAGRDLDDRGPWLEIETLGAVGLRYRAREFSGSKWHQFPPILISRVADTAGAGDWCIAALLERLGRTGVAGIEGATEETLQEALRFARAAAALACTYEGARGAMYALELQEFLDEAHTLAEEGGEAQPDRGLRLHAKSTPHAAVVEVCPGCEAENL